MKIQANILGQASVPGFNIRIIVGYVSLGVTYAIVILTLLLACHPFHGYWQIYPDPGSK